MNGKDLRTLKNAKREYERSLAERTGVAIASKRYCNLLITYAEDMIAMCDEKMANSRDETTPAVRAVRATEVDKVGTR